MCNLFCVSIKYFIRCTELYFLNLKSLNYFSMGHVKINIDIAAIYIIIICIQNKNISLRLKYLNVREIN